MIQHIQNFGNIAIFMEDNEYTVLDEKNDTILAENISKASEAVEFVKINYPEEFKEGKTSNYENKEKFKTTYKDYEVVSSSDNKMKKPSYSFIDRDVEVFDNGTIKVTYRGNWYELEKKTVKEEIKKEDVMTDISETPVEEDNTPLEAESKTDAFNFVLDNFDIKSEQEIIDILINDYDVDIEMAKEIYNDVKESIDNFDSFETTENAEISEDETIDEKKKAKKKDNIEFDDKYYENIKENKKLSPVEKALYRFLTEKIKKTVKESEQPVEDVKETPVKPEEKVNENPQVCAVCDGTGKVEGKVCNVCGGTGKQEMIEKQSDTYSIQEKNGAFVIRKNSKLVEVIQKKSFRKEIIISKNIPAQDKRDLMTIISSMM